MAKDKEPWNAVVHGLQVFQIGIYGGQAEGLEKRYRCVFLTICITFTGKLKVKFAKNLRRYLRNKDLLEENYKNLLRDLKGNLKNNGQRYPLFLK